MIMKSILRLCLHIGLFMYHLCGMAVHTDIPLGAMFDYRVDAAARSGYLYAISVYNDTSKDALSFATVYDELDISDNFRVASKICSQMAGGIFALYGKTDTKSFSIIQSFSNAFHMPYVTFSLCGSADQREKPYIVFIKPSYTDAITDIIKTFKWSRMDYIYDSDEGLMRVQYMYNKLKEANFMSKLEIGFRRIEDINNAHSDLRRLDRFHQSHKIKNVILDLSSQEAYRKILKQIPEVGMNREGYNYLLGTLDIMSLNLSRFKHGGVNITGFQLVNHSSPNVNQFLYKWRNLESTVWPGAGTHILDVDAALSIDGVEIISKALKMMIKRKERVFQYTFRRSQVFNNNRTKGIPCINPPMTWMHGQDIYESIKKVRFNGLTGQVAFDGRGYRRDYKLDVLTVSLNNGPEKIGEWDSNRGLNSVYDSQDQSKWNFTKTNYERTIVSILAPPFLYRNNKTENGRPPTGNDLYEGYCKELADALAKQLGITYRLVTVKDKKYGQELDGGSWDGIIGELRRGKADLAVAPLTITAERERVVDFSKPFMNVGISIMIQKPEKLKPGVFSFMEPFTIHIWACITIAYAIVSVSIYMASRFSPYEWSTEDLTSGHIYHNQFTLPNSFWFSMGALMLQGSDHICPRSTAGRIIGGAWWFFVLITISSYTANLAAFLTIERMLTPIDSADALAKQTDISYGTIDAGSTMAFFKKSKVITYKNMWNYMSTASPAVFTNSIQEGVERVRNSKGKYAFLMESSLNDFYNNKKPCNTMRVGPNLDLKGFGIATPLNSDLKEAINYVVLKLKEDGTLHKLQQTWWFEKGECGTNPGHRESKKRSLSLSNVSGIFYILISGLVLAMLIGLIEIYCGKKHPPKLVHYSYSRRWQNSRPNLGVTSTEHHNGLFIESMIR